MGRILRNVRLITPMSRIGRKFLGLLMRIYGRFHLSVTLGRIYGKFITTNSYAAASLLARAVVESLSVVVQS
jgi:hypothetical protein